MQKAQNILKAIAAVGQIISPVKTDQFLMDSENSIFNQQKRICNLSKVDLEKVHLALSEIDEAKKHLMGAIAALSGFDGISKRDLLIAANTAHAYDYMLQEFLHQARGGLKHENLNYGLVSVGGAR